MKIELNDQQLARVKDIEERLKVRGVADIKLFKGENWNDATVDERIDQIEVFVNVMEDEDLRIRVG